MRSASRLVAVLLLLILSHLVWAQSSTTSLRGTVTDASGAAISRANVTLSNPERSLDRTTTTDPEGGYEFLQIAPGTYRLTVQVTGFKRYEQMTSSCSSAPRPRPM